MSPSSFENVFNKIKSVTKQAAATTAKQAKLAKLRMNLITLQTEKSRYLQTIGARVYSLYKESKSLNGQTLTEHLLGEFNQIEQLDLRVYEISNEISNIQNEQAEPVEVKDITEQDLS